jgi:diacylglycerol kinase (ATP)
MRNKFLGTGTPGYHPVRKFLVVLNGLRFVARHDLSVTYKLLVSLVVMATSFYLRRWVDLVVILLVTGMVVSAEIFNTAIEALCDIVEPNENPKIAVVKDVAATAAGVPILVWGLVLFYEYCHAIKLFLEAP